MSHPSSKYVLALALVVSPAAVLSAQNAMAAGGGAEVYTQEPAPIERHTTSMPQQYGPDDRGQQPMQGGPNRYAHRDRTLTSQPAHGVTVRSEAAVQTIVSDAQHVEVKLDHGRANVMVHNPSADQLVLVDLPGGQTQLLKNGFYTFNADTNTVRVFSGEADAFAGTRDKPAHLKGDDQAVFVGGNAKVSYSDPYYSRQDVLQGGAGFAAPREEYRGDDYGYAGGYGGGYDDGFYGGYGYGFGSPYYAYDYPYYGGYGWGYPDYGFGLGFGWGGGYYGGYRGGYYGGGYYGGGRGGIGRGGGPVHPGGYGGGGFHGGSVGGGGGHVSGGGGGHR